MYNKLKSLRIEAMKTKDTVKRYALEAIIADLDKRKGQAKVGEFILDDAAVIATIKKEIKTYQEMIGREAEIEFLTNLLPSQLSEADMLIILQELVDSTSTPKTVMAALDANYMGRYDKGFVSKTVLNIKKGL